MKKMLRWSFPGYSETLILNFESNIGSKFNAIVDHTIFFVNDGFKKSFKTFKNVGMLKKWLAPLPLVVANFILNKI